MAKQTADRIMEILERERDQVLQGLFGSLSVSGDEKVRLFGLLERQGDQNVQRLQKLAAMVERNQALLSASMRGIADAQTRLKAIRSAGQGLCTYSSEGQKAALSNEKPEIERRV